MTTNYTPAVRGTGVKAKVQRIGGYLAGMVMPNISAFIAWGLITALFIPTGWVPNKTLAELAEILLDPDRAAALRAATDADEVFRLLTPVREDGAR